VSAKRRLEDGLFRLLRILELSLAAWAQRYRGSMSEAEWFGFERGYQQGLLDALESFDHPPPVLHSNRYEPIPSELQER
jgi:hypothetical protein